MAVANPLTIDQLKPGDTLPELAYDVSATTVVAGALATRDFRPMHHDRDFAIQRSGVKDIFMNTPNLALWFERYVTDWTGPLGRPGRMKFRMKGSVFAGDHMVFRGKVAKVETDDAGCAWADVSVEVTVNDRVMTACDARVAVPSSADDNPWKRSGEQWKP